MSSLYDIPEVHQDFVRDIRYRALSPKTERLYAESVNLLQQWAEKFDKPLDVTEISQDDIKDFLIYTANRNQLRYTWKKVSSSTVHKHYRHLRQFFRFAYEQSIIERNPFEGLKPPKVQQKVIPVLNDDEIRALLDACKGREFRELRDMAIILLLLDTGMRIGEFCDVLLDDVNFRTDTIVIREAKGRKQRVVAFGDAPATAMRTYLRQRGRHNKASELHFWIGKQGNLTPHGIRDMLNYRVNLAAEMNSRVNPHRFRHTFAHEWLRDGGSETDLMMLAGWSDTQMLKRYGHSAAGERAVEAHRRLRKASRG